QSQARASSLLTLKLGDDLVQHGENLPALNIALKLLKLNATAHRLARLGRSREILDAAFEEQLVLVTEPHQDPNPLIDGNARRIFATREDQHTEATRAEVDGLRGQLLRRAGTIFEINVLRDAPQLHHKLAAAGNVRAIGVAALDAPDL